MRQCEVCAGPLGPTAKIPVCRRNPTCKQENQRRHGRAYVKGHGGVLKTWRQRNPEATALIKAKSRAKAKGIPFNLAPGDIPPKPTSCPCCGRSENRERGNRGNLSLDRIIPALGYVKGNVQWLCRRCNTIKNDATPEEIMQVALFAARAGG